MTRQLMDCPGKCGAMIAIDAIACPDCGWKPPEAPKEKEAAGLSERALLAAQTRLRFTERGPSAADLSFQQWYNVSKFFPNVARRASEYSHRPLADVGPENPLDKKASLGPLLAAARYVAPREPGQEG